MPLPIMRVVDDDPIVPYQLPRASMRILLADSSRRGVAPFWYVRIMDKFPI